MVTMSRRSGLHRGGGGRGGSWEDEATIPTDSVGTASWHLPQASRQFERLASQALGLQVGKLGLEDARTLSSLAGAVQAHIFIPTQGEAQGRVCDL